MEPGPRVRALIALAAAACALSPLPAGASAASLPPIRHVFIIVLENESASTTFGPSSPAPYLAKTLTAEGAYLPHYYAIGHESNDNYVAMVSGQAPSAQSQADCQVFGDLLPGTIGAYGQATGTGCVYPASVPTIASQLTAAGYTWRDYNESMGANPARESSVCGHPGLNTRDVTETATATDQYVTRHNPFVYFHSVIDNSALCDANVVSLNQLPQDLSSVSQTANYSFITPNVCDDGHDSPCADGEPGGLPQADRFLQTWVPRITGSPAFQQDGLLIITFDEGATSDTTSCCGEIAGPNSPSPGITGPGGGDVGAVLLSPCIAPRTVSQIAYNHYSMLGSIENLFGLVRLGYAGLPGEAYFGADIFGTGCGGAAGGGPPGRGGTVGGGGSPPQVEVSSPVIASQVASRPRIPVRWGSTPIFRYDVQVRDLSRRARWRRLLVDTSRHRLMFAGALGHTYLFRVRVDDKRRRGAWTEAITIVPTGFRFEGARLRGRWRVLHRRGAWLQHVLQTTRPDASLTLRFTGASVSVIGDRTARNGRLRITLDGRSRTIALGARHLSRRQILCTVKATPGVHRLTITDIGGLVALEGLAILDQVG